MSTFLQEWTQASGREGVRVLVRKILAMPIALAGKDSLAERSNGM